MSQTVLGLDLGAASIGWSLIDEEAQQILGSGVRVFQSTLEDKTPTPKNAKRRNARGLRKTIRRRQMRRDTLVSLLRANGLLPNAGSEWDELFFLHEQNPYVLRARGLDEKLTPDQFGRALFHLSRRRGFKSNRRTALTDLETDPEIAEFIAEEERAKAEQTKVAKSAVEDDEGIVAMEVGRLRQEMLATGSRTLGEHFHRLLSATDDLGRSVWQNVRRRHTERAMYQEEFEALWDAQAVHYPNQLNAPLKARVFDAIFHQRRLKVQRFMVGKCRFEPDRQRADKAHPVIQDLRIWQKLNNLTYAKPGERAGTSLNLKQRKAVADQLQSTARLSWAGVRKATGVSKMTKFNLEEGGEKELVGNTTVIRIERVSPGLWGSLDETQREALVTSLLTIERKDALVKHLRSKWQLPLEQAYRLATQELDAGVGALSLQAAKNILPHLAAGLNFHDAVVAAANALRLEGKATKADRYIHEYQREEAPLPSLPLEMVPDARNPVVNKCLHEARRMINAIVREYGRPDVVRIEMARDMKLSRVQRAEADRRNKANERLNAEAVENGAKTRDDKLKYRLWKECDGICPYTGISISLQMLLGSEVDVEHIVPYSRSLDDSYANKTLCLAEENRLRKRNQAPCAAYDGTAQYEDILRRVDEMKCGRHKKKLFRLSSKEIDDLYGDFAKRMLNDTRYVCVQVRDFVKKLGCDVQVSKGEATAALRRKWGLESVLSHDADGEKNRADHRHHAVDALVIACTSIRLLHKLSNVSADRERDPETGKGKALSDHDFPAPEPWPEFRRAAEAAVKGVFVSHQATRGVSGALHEATAYGYDAKKGKFTTRKAVDALTDGDVERIRDTRLRERVRQYRAELALAKTRAKEARDKGDRSEESAELALKFQDRHGQTKSVRRVKIDSVKSSPDQMLQVASRPSPALGFSDVERRPKYFPSGSNHHLLVLRHRSTGKMRALATPMYVAAQRAVRGQPLFQAPADGEWEVLHALCKNDIVEVEGMPQRYYKVNSFSVGDGNDFKFQALTEARPFDNSRDLRWRSPSALAAIKRRVTIDRLGRAWPACDRIFNQS